MTTAMRRPLTLAVAPPSSRQASAPTATDWMRHGVCVGAGRDADLWFPVGTTGPARDQIEDAKAECRRCPVMELCRTWALATKQADGVWGGMSLDERDTYLRKQRWLDEGKVGPMPRAKPTYQACLDQRSRIEALLAEGRSQASIARELGVGEDALNRAVRHFRSEAAKVASVGPPTVVPMRDMAVSA